MPSPSTTSTTRAPLAASLAPLVLLACSASEPELRGPSSSPASTPPPATSASAVEPSVSGSASPADSAALTPVAPYVRGARARRFLFAEGVPADAGCGAEPKDEEASEVHGPFIRCLLNQRFAGDAAARDAALELFTTSGDVAAAEETFEMDGGFRGSIKLVGELPVGTQRRHLTWVLSAKRAMKELEEALTRAAPPGRALAYRDGAVLWKFARSVGRTTPSAYAGGWEIGWNVAGSLHSSERAVRDTIVHEIFHLNDQDHGGWSRRALGEIVDGIVARCGTNVACLTPYAPGKTRVRGGTYYAFQPDNGDLAHEYSAELATRYFNEQLATARGEKLTELAFKCGPEENARAMRLLAEEFFGGVDLTPPCRGGDPR